MTINQIVVKNIPTMIPNEDNVIPRSRMPVIGSYYRVPVTILNLVFATNNSPPQCINLSFKFPPPFEEQTCIDVPDPFDA